MKFGLDIPTAGSNADPRRLADLASEAEVAGWDGFFIWDVLFADGTVEEPILNPWVTLAATAMKTRRIRIGAFMTPLPRRHPWQVAKETVTLDLLSNGRLIFGAALGYQALDFTSFGEEFDPRIRAEKLDEGLEILTGLWTGERFSFHGKHYQVDNVRFLPRPVQKPRIPVWLAGGWPRRRPFRRAAAWDGIYLMTVNQSTGQLLTPQDVREIVAFIKAQRSSQWPFDIAVNGRTPSDPREGAQIVQPYVDAGATWWIEYAGPRSFEDYRERIQSGPPKV